MTDQKYKLVPVEPTQDMIEWVQAACVEHLSPREAYDIAKTLVAHVPEPVCRHRPSASVDSLEGALTNATECGNTVDALSDFPFCPHCGKKVEAVKDE